MRKEGTEGEEGKEEEESYDAQQIREIGRIMSCTKRKQEGSASKRGSTSGKVAVRAIRSARCLRREKGEGRWRSGRWVVM